MAGLYMYFKFLPRDATQSAVLLSYVVRPSVRPSVCLSVCLSVTFRYRDHIGWNRAVYLYGSGLEFFENNFAAE